MKKYFAMVAVATMFAACTNEDVTPQVDAMTGMPIVVKTNIAKPVDSRVAGMDDVNDIPGFILNIEPTTDGGTDIFTQMSYKEYNPESPWEPNFNGEMVWANSDPVKVSAVYSANIAIGSEDGYATSYGFWVATDQSDIENFKNSDVLYMPPTDITPSLEGIEVNFQHLYSKVQISIEAEGTVSDVIIGGTFSNRDFKCSTGEWGSRAVLEEIKAATDTEKGTYEAILVPQEVDAETFYVSFKIGETTYKWTSAEAVTLESGNLYTINLTADTDPTGATVLIKSINVAGWNSETTSMGGEATWK